MRRLLATLRSDVLRQYRNGLYGVTVAVGLFYVALLQLVPANHRIDLPLLIPAFLMFNVLITTFYLVAGLVLLESSERSLGALVVTPLRVSEYLCSKVVTLTGLAIAENLFVVLIFYGWRFAVGPLLVGMLLLCSLSTLLGFALVGRYDSVNEFLIPSIFVSMPLFLPLLPHLGIVGAPLDLVFYAHPAQPAFVLIRSAFGTTSTTEIAYGVAGGLGWLTAAYLLARDSFRRLVESSA